MTTINEFLSKYTLERIKGIKNMNNPFNIYKPLDRGNSKLEKNILSFSLLPGVTCGQRCKGCYDLRALRYPSVRQKRLFNTWLSVHMIPELKRIIVQQIINSKTVEFIRIHVGGDFHSMDYFNMWIEIKKEVSKLKPGVKFYTYTKTHLGKELRKAGINCVESAVQGLGYNFGSLEKLKSFKRKNKGFTICPATLGKDVKCGKTCKACMVKKDILFVTH